MVVGSGTGVAAGRQQGSFLDIRPTIHYKTPIVPSASGELTTQPLEGDAMRILRSVIPAFVFLVNLCTPDILLAAESSSYIPDTAAYHTIWSTILIVFLSRKSAIGGWLLLFYVQTYVGILVTLLMLRIILSDMDPSDWESSKNYIFHLISLLPIFIYLFVEAIVATRLLFHRNQASVIFFKKLLIAGLAIFGLSLTIDLAVFKEESMIIRSIMSLIFAAVWTLYFWTSRRVDWVLANDYTWDSEAFKKGLPVAKRQS
jgi:hypothetical protein